MKLFSTSLWILIVLVFLMACPGTNPPLEQEPASIKSILSSLPALEFKLPKSLGGEEESAVTSKAMGDVTLLDSSNVQGVKSNSWASLKQSNIMQVMIQYGLNLIKNYAKVNDISTDIPFYYTLTEQDNNDFWIGLMKIPAYPPSIVTRAGIIITGVESDFTLHVKVDVTWDEDDFNGSAMSGYLTILNKLNIKTSNNNSKLEIVSDVTGETNYGDGSSSTTNNKILSTLDTQSGSGDFYFSQDNGQYSSSGLMSTKVLADNSMAIINTNEGYDSITVAWGNDSIGGSLYANSNYYSSEYYSGNGNLAYRTNGSDSPGSYYVDNMINVNTLLGAPATIYLRKNGDTFEITDDISGTPSWTALAQYGLQDSNGNGMYDDGEAYYSGFYSKAGSDWVAGDIIYGWSDYNSNSPYGALTIYTPTIIAKDPVQKLGHSYYLTYEYPLNNLLPLAAPYNTLFQLAQEETYSDTWTWYDFEGNEQISTYYSYDYYLDAIGDADNDDDPSSMFFNPTVDISISNLNQYDIFYWNGSEYVQDKAYFYYCENLPAYFNGPEAIGDQVDARINDVYSSYVENLDYSYYSNKVDAMAADNQYFSQLD